ncbi:MAG: hypothetical protein WAO58_09740 [Fimbriimonadaceae bacterium]
MIILLAAATLGPKDYVVQPYYTYPADQPYHAEYVRAINNATLEIQAWFKKQAGITFRLAPLRIKKGEDYLTMRAGINPSEQDRKDKTRLPLWWEAQERTVGGWKDKTVSWIFAQGGGGVALGNLINRWAGIAMFGDWTLEPISGIREPLAITADMATWEVQGGVPMGTTAHELGHAFGIHHPDNYPGKSIMRWHGDYPDKTSLLPHEIMILHYSPFFVKNAFDENGPWLNFENPDAMKWGETVSLQGKGFKIGDRIEFRTIPVEAFDKAAKEGFKKYERVNVAVAQFNSPTELRVAIPRNLGPGFIRVLRGSKTRSNIVPVNFYPATSSGS